MRAIAALTLTLCLGGCAVTSEAPLFGPADRAAHPLAQGLWALHGPGCDVAPAQALPECAIPLGVHGDLLEPGGQDMLGAMGAMGAAGGAGGMGGKSQFLLAEGDPQILQLRDLSKPASDGAQPATPAKPGALSYMAFRPMHHNAAGESDAGVLWLVTCPKTPDTTPGFKSTVTACEATTGKAVLEQARHIPPLMSFFMTWVSASMPTPAAKP